eukprot:scaffold8156_cov92-Isochrysis_galbana.AAC.1
MAEHERRVVEDGINARELNPNLDDHPNQELLPKLHIPDELRDGVRAATPRGIDLGLELGKDLDRRRGLVQQHKGGEGAAGPVLLYQEGGALRAKREHDQLEEGERRRNQEHETPVTCRPEGVEGGSGEEVGQGDADDDADLAGGRVGGGRSGRARGRKAREGWAKGAGRKSQGRIGGSGKARGDLHAPTDLRMPMRPRPNPGFRWARSRSCSCPRPSAPPRPPRRWRRGQGAAPTTRCRSTSGTAGQKQNAEQKQNAGVGSGLGCCGDGLVADGADNGTGA